MLFWWGFFSIILAMFSLFLKETFSRLQPSSLTSLLLLCLLLIFGGACHTNSKIERLPVRASKSLILKNLGEPYKIKWKDGKAYWTYKFIIEGRHYTRDLILKDGVLYKTSGFKPFRMRNF